MEFIHRGGMPKSFRRHLENPDYLRQRAETQIELSYGALIRAYFTESDLGKLAIKGDDDKIEDRVDRVLILAVLNAKMTGQTYWRMKIPVSAVDRLAWHIERFKDQGAHLKGARKGGHSRAWMTLQRQLENRQLL